MTIVWRRRSQPGLGSCGCRARPHEPDWAARGDLGGADRGTDDDRDRPAIHSTTSIRRRRGKVVGAGAVAKEIVFRFCGLRSAWRNDFSLARLRPLSNDEAVERAVLRAELGDPPAWDPADRGDILRR